MKPGQLSRADLLAALAEGNRQIGCRVAKGLRLFYGPPKKNFPSFSPQSISQETDSPSLNLFSDLSNIGAQIPDQQPLKYINKTISPVAGLNLSPTSQLPPCYLQLIRYTLLNLDIEEQKENTNTCPVTWKNRPNKIPEYPTLTSLEDLHTRLLHRQASDCQGGRAIDLSAVMDKISRAEFPGRLPVTTQQQSLDALQIIDDRQVHLSPYWSDHTRLTLHLYDTFGPGQISRAVITNGDTEPRRISRDFFLRPFHLPPAGTPVLFLSDLGRLSHQGSGDFRSFNRRQQQYRDLVRRLLRNNNPVTLLTPCSPVDYPALLRRQIRCLSWEAQARPLPAGTDDGPDRLSQWTEHLLTLAAPAIRLEPQLLRCLRRGMHRFGPQPPAAVESLCWQYPDIKEPHNVAATFHAQARKERLGKFAALPAEQQRFALQQLRLWRQPLPDEIWFEELLNIEALLDKKTVFQGEELEAMEQDIQTGCQFISQLLEQGKLTDPAYQAWAIRLESRMCEPAVQQGAARQELQTVFSRLNPGKSTSRSGHALDPEMLPPVDQPEQKAWLCQQGRRLVVTRHVPTQVPRQNTSMIAALSYRRPEIKLVMSDSSSRSLDLPVTLTETLEPLTTADEIPLLELSSFKTDLTKLRLQAVEKPAWANSMGRDCFGLYAELSILNQKGEEVVQGFRWIPAGEFIMGSPGKEIKRFNYEDYHKVTLTRGYWLADTAVTQSMWRAITGNNPARFLDNEFNPVEEVSWNDAQEYIAKLNGRIQETGMVEGDMVFRLATEAEWEHACRAGTDTPFSFGENIMTKQVNYNGHFPFRKGKFIISICRKKTVPVQSLPPNPWGLYEMHGNVWEWCADSWQKRLGEQPVADPYYASGSFRVLRGGSWFSGGWYVRSAFRNHFSPGNRNVNFGFRLAFGHKLRPHGSAKQGKGAGTSQDKERTE